VVKEAAAVKKKAFISGPIQGMEAEQGYREDIGSICIRLGYQVVDPWLREKAIYRKDEPQWWTNVPAAGFIERDLEDIQKCDVVIAYLPKLSAGTCMEIFYAKRRGKKVIVISGMKDLSPWVVVHSDVILGSIEELEDALKQTP
jgi:nucleoside 2-deoxyribosyltransferase